MARAQDQASTPGFNTMDRVAGNILKNPRHERLREVAHQALDGGACADHLVHLGNLDPRGGAGELHDIMSESLIGDRCSCEAGDALAAKNRHLSRATVLHDGHQRDDDVVRKVGVVEGLTHLAEHLTLLQAHNLQVRLQTDEVFWVESGQELVCPRADPAYRISAEYIRYLAPLWFFNLMERSQKEVVFS